MQNWLWATAADLGRGIERGEIDPINLCETYLNAIDGHKLRDRIYACVTHDRARTEAKAASARAKVGQRLSPLDGVPVSWKDLFDTAGVATEAGTKLMEGRVPTQDAERRFLVGRHPVRQQVFAFGLAAAAVGSDTGGSVRIPSVWNDLVGLKTTFGRLPLDGSVALCSQFDTVGPLCRSVEDAGLMLAALEGRKVDDLAGTSLKGLRFGALQSVVLDDVSTASMAGYTAAIEKLKAAGAAIVPVKVSALERAFEMSLPLYTADAYANWRDLVEADPNKMFHQILERVSGGKNVLAHDYLALWDELRDIREAYAQATAEFDAVLCPGAANMPPNLERLASDTEYYQRENLLTLRNTRVANLMGLGIIGAANGHSICWDFGERGSGKRCAPIAHRGGC
ncbi:2-amino-5-chloromuconic acid deaminase [Nymphon striatum]|nr:2-amino-5-chloromuconic acid deaminase [Nymphon striatum]